MEEIYKDIPGYEGAYMISSMCNIKSLNTNFNGRVLKHITRNDGRQYIGLYKDGIYKHYLVYRLLMITFVGLHGDPNKNEINHKDGDKQNNTLDNLEWVTRSENQSHRYSHLGHSSWRKGKTNVNPTNSIKVDQFDLLGNFLNTFNSCKEAERVLNNGTTGKGISYCINGKRKTHNGYIFKRSENEKSS